MSDDVKAAIHPHDAVVHRFLQHYGMPSRTDAAAVLNAAVEAGMAPATEVDRLREENHHLRVGLARTVSRLEAVLGEARAALDGDDR